MSRKMLIEKKSISNHIELQQLDLRAHIKGYGQLKDEANISS